MNYNTKQSQAFRANKKKNGLKEMRGIWVTDEEEKIIKPHIRAKLEKLRSSNG